jgi:cytochrome c-type biogenesis protein CcmE
MKTYAKFTVLVVAILGTLGWLAFSGINESKTYYKTISELKSMNPEDQARRLRVTGDVVAGSIVRAGDQVRFTIVEKEKGFTLNVLYMGKDPLPDTFRDDAQAMADGKLSSDGTFHAQTIAAKCPSKYEAEPGKKPASAPVQRSAS